MPKPSAGKKLHNVDGEYIGDVLHTDGSVCWYARPDGVSDCFIWRFKDGLNRRIDWSLF